MDMNIIIPAGVSDVYVKQLEDNGYTVTFMTWSMDSKYAVDVEWENTDDQ